VRRRAPRGYATTPLESLRLSFKITGSSHLGCLLNSPTASGEIGIKTVRHGEPIRTSQSTALECGVPRGSVLGQILFVMYITDLHAVVDRHGLPPHHFYADNSQRDVTCSCSSIGVVTYQPIGIAQRSDAGRKTT
jgi:hypothetical protein